MHLQQLVDFLDLEACAGGDALFAAGLEDVGILALLARHGVDHRHLTLDDLVVEVCSGDLVLHLGDAGHHAHQAAETTHGLHLRKLIAQVGKIELALAHLLGDARGFFRIDMRCGLLDEGDDVAHAEDAARNTRRMEVFQRIGLFTGADQLDRLAGNGAH